MMELFKIAGKVELDGADKASKDLDKLDGKGKSTAAKLGGFAKTAAKGAAIAGSAAVGMGVAAFTATKKVTDGFDHIAKTSSKMGVSTDAYQEMDYWASQNGISSENMEKAVGRLNQRIGMAADGNEKYGSALSALGVDMDGVRDGTISTEDAMYQSIQALSEMESETDKAALASELFGTKLGRELMPALQDGSLSLEEAKQKAEELGIVIDGDTLAAAEAFNDTWDDLTRSMKAFAQKVLSQLMPVFQLMMDWVLSNMPQIQSIFSTVFDAIGVVLSTVGGYIQDTISWLVSLKDSIVSNLGGSQHIFESFKPIVENLKNTFMNLVRDVKPLWKDLKGLFESLKPILVALGVVVGGTIVVAFGLLVGVFNGVVAALTPLINSVINFGDFAINVFNAVIALITGDFVGAWDYLVVAGESALKMFGNLFKAVYELIKGIVTGIIDFFYGLYMTLVGNSIIPDMVNAIIDWFVKLKDLAIEKVMELVNAVVQWFVNLYNSTIDTIGVMISYVVDKFTEMKDKAQEIMKVFLDIIKNIWTYIQQTFENALDFILALVTLDFTGMKNAMKNQMENAKNLLSNIWENIKKIIGDKAAEILSNIISKFTEIKDNIKNKIEEAKTAAINKFTEMTSGVIRKASEILRDIKSKFEDIKQNMKNKIEDAKSAVISKFTSLVSDIISKASEILSNIISKFEEIKQNMSNKISEAKDLVSKTFGNMITDVKTKASEIVSTVKDKFDDAKNKIIEPIEAAKDKVSGIIEDIKGFFSNLKLKIPKPEMPKMPKFSLKTSSRKVLGKTIKYPTGLGVNWNADGGIFKRPTIFNTENAGLQGVGEAGAEAIIPLNKKTLGSIGESIAGTMPRQVANVIQSNESDKQLLNATLEQNRLLSELIRSSKNIEAKPILTDRDVTDAVNNRNAWDNIGKIR